MSWPFDTPLLSPLGVCCVVFVCVLVLVVFRPCCGVLLFGCFLCPSHRPNLSRPLGGGSAESRLWWSPGGVSLSPFPLLGVAWGLREMHTLLSLYICFTLATLLTFASSRPCEFISHGLLGTFHLDVAGFYLSCALPLDRILIFLIKLTGFYLS